MNEGSGPVETLLNACALGVAMLQIEKQAHTERGDAAQSRAIGHAIDTIAEAMEKAEKRANELLADS